jgi:hypothetical protein
VAYGKQQLERLWVQAGGKPAAARTAAAVALAESSGQPGAEGHNTNGTTDRGLWQINSIHGRQSTTDILANARAAVAISNNGASWHPWVTYNKGTYRHFLGGKGASGAETGPGGARTPGGGVQAVRSESGPGEPSPEALAQVLEAVKQLSGPQALGSPPPPATSAHPTLPAGAQAPAPLPAQQPPDVAKLLEAALSGAPRNVESKVTATGGGGGGAETTPAVPAGAGLYGALVRGALKYAGPDQGIDFTGAGTVRAPARIKVTRVQRNSGWAGEGTIIAGKILSGPGRGRYIYAAEDIQPGRGVRPGAILEPGTELGRATGSGRAPGIEVGFAQGPEGRAYGDTHMGKPGGSAPVYGQQFGRYIQRIGRR